MIDAWGGWQLFQELLETLDIIAKKHNVLYGVDSTFSTPALLRPIEFGADITMHSTTKYLSGHNQIIGGSIHTNNEEIFKKSEITPKVNPKII